MSVETVASRDRRVSADAWRTVGDHVDQRPCCRTVFQAEVPGISGLHLHPRDIGGAIVSVDQTDDWDEWPWAGPEWRRHIRRDTVTDIVAVAVSADDRRLEIAGTTVNVLPAG
jgi:hypothetical protein